MSFKRYALERTAATVVVLWLAVTVLFFALHDDPFGGTPPPAPFAGYFDRSYGEHLGKVLSGDLGVSFADGRGRPAGARAVDRLGASVSLVCAGLLLAALIAGLVALAGRRAVRTFAYLAFAVPFAVTGVSLAYWVGFRLGWPAISGYCYPFDPPYEVPAGYERPCSNDIGEWAWHLLLPGVTLSLPFAAVYSRVLRAARLPAADAGLGDEVRRRRTRLRLLSIVKLFGRDFGFALGLAFIVEAIFGIPGLGSAAYEALLFDPPMVEAAVIVATVTAFTVQLAVDLACGWLEPELRLP